MNNEIINNLNIYLSDINILYIKFHNMHWNVTGRQFKNMHEYLESLYQTFANYLDETAEILKMHDCYPLASMKDYINTSNISELPSKDFSIQEVLEICKQDISQMKSFAEKIRLQADNNDIYDIVAMMENHLANYNKTIWFLSSMLI